MAPSARPGGVVGAADDGSPPPRERSSLFLWHGRALFIGEDSFSPTSHRNYATQVGVSLGEPFQVRTRQGETYEPYVGFVVAPNATHHMETTAAPAVFLWTEAADLAARLAPEYGVEIGRIRPEKLAALVPELRTAVDLQETGRLDCAAADALFRLVIETVARPAEVGETRPPLDPRVQRALETIRERSTTRLEDPIGRLAAEAHLSQSRFRHLFRMQVGLSVQRYLLWQRLLAALEAAAHGASLSEAAHEAGFADSAHMSRTFRDSFGLTPSEILKNSHYVQVVPCF